MAKETFLALRLAGISIIKIFDPKYHCNEERSYAYAASKYFEASNCRTQQTVVGEQEYAHGATQPKVDLQKGYIYIYETPTQKLSTQHTQRVNIGSSLKALRNPSLIDVHRLSDSDATGKVRPALVTKEAHGSTTHAIR